MLYVPARSRASIAGVPRAFFDAHVETSSVPHIRVKRNCVRVRLPPPPCKIWLLFPLNVFVVVFCFLFFFSIILECGDCCSGSSLLLSLSDIMALRHFSACPRLYVLPVSRSVFSFFFRPRGEDRFELSVVAYHPGGEQTSLGWFTRCRRGKGSIVCLVRLERELRELRSPVKLGWFIVGDAGSQ